MAHVHLEPHGLCVSLFRNLIRNGMWPTSIWNLMVCVCLSLGTSSAMECCPRPSGTSWSVCVSLYEPHPQWNVAHVHLEPHGLCVSLFRNLIRNGMWPTSIWNLMVCVCLSLGTSSAMECGPRPSGTSWSVCVSL